MKKPIQRKALQSLGTILGGIAASALAGSSAGATMANTVPQSTNSGASYQKSCSMGSSWAAQVKTTLPSLASVMSSVGQAPKQAPPPVAPPHGFVLDTQLVVGDNDVLNFSQGKNAMAPASSRQVSLYDDTAGKRGNGNVSLVMGYWVVPTTTDPNSALPVAGSAFGGGAPAQGQWFPIGYLDNTLTINASNASPGSTAGTFTPVNKHAGAAYSIANVFDEKTMELVNQANSSYHMNGEASNYTAYFALMACQRRDLQGPGRMGNQDMPDGLEISDFVSTLPTALQGATLSSGVNVYYTPPTGTNDLSGVAGKLSLSGTGNPLVSVDANALSNNELYRLGTQVAALTSGMTAPPKLQTLANDLRSKSQCSQVGVVNRLGQEGQRWFEPNPMNLTCEALKDLPSLVGSLGTNFGATNTSQQTLASALEVAGAVQLVENKLSAAVQAPTVSCLPSGGTSQQYISTVLASVVIPFTHDGNQLAAHSPGTMTHPESLFADGGYATYYCLPSNSGNGVTCKGSNGNTIFGMTLPYTPPAPVAENSSPSAFEAAEVLYPQLFLINQLLPQNASAMPMMMMDDDDIPAAAAAMIAKEEAAAAAAAAAAASGDPAAVAAAAMLNATATANASANVLRGIPLNWGSSSNVSATNLIPSGISLTMRIRAYGTCSGICFCKADFPELYQKADSR